jgi:predicted Zn-dependent protease
MDRPQELIDRVLDLARARDNVIDCVVLVECSSGANLRWANSTLTTNGSRRSLDLTIVLYYGTTSGVALGLASRSSNHFDQNSIRSMLDQAEAAARAAGPSPETADLARGVVVGDYEGDPLSTDSGIFAAVAPQLGDLFARDTTAYYGFAAHSILSTYASSLSGLRVRTDALDGYLELNGRRSGLSAWVGRPSRAFDFDLSDLASELSRKLKCQEKVIDVAPGRHSVVLEPAAVADLTGYLAYSLSGREAAEGRSVFSKAGGTRIGERLCALPLNLYSDPAYAGLEVPDVVLDVTSSSTSSPFDVGQRLGRVDWISNGVLANLETTRYTARAFDLAHAPSASNLILEVEGARGGSTNLVAGLEHGLLVTCLWYIREVDPETLLVTGLTRDGVYVVEDGEIVGSSRNFRFNESPVGMLERVRGAGATMPALPRELAGDMSDLAVPALLVDEFNLSSVADSL